MAQQAKDGVSDVIELTAEERQFLYFIPPAPTDMQPPEHVQASLQAKGLASATQAEGRRYLTLLGDKVQRQAVPVKVVG